MTRTGERRADRFQLQPDDMIVTRVSQSPKLPRRIEYSLTYTRRPETR